MTIIEFVHNTGALALCLYITVGLLMAGVATGLLLKEQAAAPGKTATADAMGRAHKIGTFDHGTIYDFTTTDGTRCLITAHNNGLALSCDWQRND